MGVAFGIFGACEYTPILLRPIDHADFVAVLEIPANAGDYDCDTPPNRFVELIQGRGANDSPGEVAARSVEMIAAMFRSAAQGGKPVQVLEEVRITV